MNEDIDVYYFEDYTYTLDEYILKYYVNGKQLTDKDLINDNSI